MRKSRSLDAAYFEGLYRQDPDPWGFETSAYETAKYADTLAALGAERAARGLELGCSIGVLTRDLAPVCDRLVATELSAIALEQARRRCADLPQVEFRLAHTVTDGIDGVFDLMVLSEVVYYWDAQDLGAVAGRILETLAPGGRLLLVHWLGETDYPKSADDAVTALAGCLQGAFDTEIAERREQYRLDLWRRKTRP
jgi:SAM-dependent methyltransferase